MSQIAQSAVFVTCAEGAAAEASARLPHIRGPTGPFVGNLAETLACYPELGFQASHFGQACRLAQEMVVPQPPSKLFMVREGAFVEIDDAGNLVEASPTPSVASAAVSGACCEGRADTEKAAPPPPRVYPTLFCGMTANLLGTGCREALRFLVREGVEPRHTRHPSTLTASGVRDSTIGSQTTGAVAAAEAAVLAEKTHIQALLEHEIGAFEPAIGCESSTVVFAPPPLPPYKSFLSAIVTSGGGIEHDIRRACSPYDITHYSSEACATTTTTGTPPPPANETGSDRLAGRFGNVEYGRPHSDRHGSSPDSDAHATRAPASGDSLFDLVMRQLVRRLMQRQASAYRVAQSLPIPDPYVDTCGWSLTPSEVWCLAGLWLPSLLFESLCELRGVGTAHGASNRARDAAHGVTEGAEWVDATARGESEELRQRLETEARARAESTVVYWAACQEVPIFSPSFADGDIMTYVLEEAERLEAAQDAPVASALTRLKVDLVRDVYYINKLAMLSKFTGMIICGGGVVKHHICNANLMRNGADVSIFLNDGQEFDGSDGGARPEEAISWGKIRIDGRAVKVYSEVTAVFPLLVASAFVPAVRERRD